MNGTQDEARAIAARVASRLSGEPRLQEDKTEPDSLGGVSEELAGMRASLDALQRKLVQIESRISPRSDAATRRAASHDAPRPREVEVVSTPAHGEAAVAPVARLSGIYVPAAHPSQERFGVDEATVSELVDYFESTRTCDLEPGGKPCDHCAMCSSRGF